MPSQDVLEILASLNGGFNGGFEGKQIGVEILTDSTCIYSLTDVQADPPVTESFMLTLTPYEAPAL
jgi:hypothetical protein